MKFAIIFDGDIMPALFTHYKFGQDVLKKLPNNLKNEISKNIKHYNMFNQGFDNLFYHHKHWKYYKDFAINAHTKNIPCFFETMINYIIDNRLTTDSELTNMIYGFINHYTVDTIIHPFINYQVTNLNISHAKIEFILDKMESTKYKNSIYKTIIPRLKFSKNLISLINYCFEKTYDEKNIGKIFNKSHNNNYYIYRYFFTDKTGIKTLLYKFIDSIFSNNEFHFQDYTLHIKKLNNKILNENNLVWYPPNHKKEKYNYSYYDLYNVCLTISTKLNIITYEVLNGNLKIKYLINLIKKINLKNIEEFMEL